MKIGILFLFAGTLIAKSGNLIVNGDFNGGVSGFSSDYFFIASGQSQTPDTFGIRTNSQDFNPAYTLFADHTSGSGNMMLVDGYPAANKIVWTETISVRTNEVYLFAAWATSADPANVPVLRFLINGIPVGSDLTLSANSGQWQQFLVRWNSGTNLSATLSIVDENLIDYGNDFALDDLLFVSARPFLIINSSAPQQVQLGWNSVSNQIYQIEYSTTLTNWFNLGDTVPGNGGTNYIFDSTLTPAAKFYRVQVVQ